MSSGSGISEIPEGETRLVSNHTYTKHLPAIAFSHYESRDEVRELDYTPCINRNDHRRAGRPFAFPHCLPAPLLPPQAVLWT